MSGKRSVVDNCAKLLKQRLYFFCVLGVLVSENMFTVIK